MEDLLLDMHDLGISSEVFVNVECLDENLNFNYRKELSAIIKYNSNKNKSHRIIKIRGRIPIIYKKSIDSYYLELFIVLKDGKSFKIEGHYFNKELRYKLVDFTKPGIDIRGVVYHNLPNLEYIIHCNSEEPILIRIINYLGYIAEERNRIFRPSPMEVFIQKKTRI